MQCETDPTVHPDEVHRFFPEWADRPEARGLFLESERNSYLAGGYSEEFGYRTPAGGSGVFPLLRGDPELCSQWRVEIGCLHPGYPECPRPFDRGRFGLESGCGRDHPEGQPEKPLRDGSSSGHAAVKSGVTNVVPVARSAELRGDGLPARLATIWIRFRIRRRQLGSLF